MEKEKILYCDSQGDKRFSALYAQITIDGVTNTIENFYQDCKRDSLDNVPGKGKPVDHIIWKGVKRPASDLTPLYEELWELYFKENPNLLQYACQFDKFIDRFKGKSINSQADVICKLVKINKIGGEKIMQKEILKVKSIKQLNHYYYSGDRELLFCINVESLDLESLIKLSSYARSDFKFIGKGGLVVNYKIIDKCREIICKKYTTIDVPMKKDRPDYKSLVNILKGIRDLFCIKKLMNFTKEVRDPDFYSAGVIDTEIVGYFEYIPIIPIVIQINGDADLYMKMVHGYCINGKETQPLIEKVKGLTVRIMNPFGEMETFNHKDIRRMWERNRIACASECTQYSIENPIVDDSVLNKLGMVLSAYGPYRIVKDDLTECRSRIEEIIKNSNIDRCDEAVKRIIEGDYDAVDAFINYCLETNIKIYNFVDINKINELYETVKPEYYGNANYLEAQIYGYGLDEE